jgi:hypothetical protein
MGCLPLESGWSGGFHGSLRNWLGAITGDSAWVCARMVPWMSMNHSRGRHRR